MIVLDTHALVWAVSDDRKLGRKARALIEAAWPAGKIAIATISFWEIGLLHARRRLHLPKPVREWRDEVVAAGIVEFPLDGNVAVRALDFAGLHDDPADRFIVATAVEQGAVLMTADERLLAWRHALERHDARN